MKQILYVTPGAKAPESVALVDVEPLSPGPGEVVVAVKARPINPADLLLLEGRHVFRPDLPARVGIEGAGVVCASGISAAVAVGARVALPYGGTWSEQVAIPADDVVVLPDAISLESGSMLSVNPFTAAGLLEGLRAGDWIVCNAATSAVSRMVLALAARRGLFAVAVVRSLSARDDLLAAGAAAVVLDSDALASDVRALARGPVVRALDAVAGRASSRMFGCVADGGELVVYGLLSGDEVVLPASGVVFRDVRVRGFSRLRAMKAMEPARRAAVTAEILALAQEGLFDSTIEATYPLEEVRDALRHHLRPDRRGKVLLVS